MLGGRKGGQGQEKKGGAGGGDLKCIQQQLYTYITSV